MKNSTNTPAVNSLSTARQEVAILCRLAMDDRFSLAEVREVVAHWRGHREGSHIIIQKLKAHGYPAYAGAVLA